MTEAASAIARTGVPTKSVYSTRRPTGWAHWISFASTLMGLTGCFNIIQGLIAVLDDQYYLVTDGGLVVQADYTVWGWTYMAVGVVIIAAAVAVLWGRAWARVVGVILAGTSALLNFTFIAAYPIWSIIVITVDVFIILALTVHGSDAETA